MAQLDVARARKDRFTWRRSRVASCLQRAADDQSKHGGQRQWFVGAWCVKVGGMTLAVPGATGFVALAQRAVIGMRVSPRVGGQDAHEGFRRSVRGNGDRPGHLAMSPHPRPPHGRLTWMEPDGRHERTSAWQDRDAATAFEGWKAAGRLDEFIASEFALQKSA